MVERPLHIFSTSETGSNDVIRVAFYPDSVNDVNKDTVIGYIIIKLSQPPVLQIYPCTSSENEDGDDAENAGRYTSFEHILPTKETKIWKIWKVTSDQANRLMIACNDAVVHYKYLSKCRANWIDQSVAKLAFWSTDTASLLYGNKVTGLFCYN